MVPIVRGLAVDVGHAGDAEWAETLQMTLIDRKCHWIDSDISLEVQ